MCFAPQRRAIFPDRDLQNGSGAEVFCTFWLTNVLRATAACLFFQIETCKMAPTLRCFVHFDVEMCFAPQRRAIFPDRDLQNGSDTEVFCTFWRRNVLRATAACNFSYLFSAAPSAPAALTSLFCRHQNARIIEKTQRFATFLTFRAHVSSETWLLLYSCFPWLLCCATLFFCDLNTVRLCFSTLLFNCPYCRKLDSKLPSTTTTTELTYTNSSNNWNKSRKKTSNNNSITTNTVSCSSKHDEQESKKEQDKANVEVKSSWTSVY